MVAVGLDRRVQAAGGRLSVAVPEKNGQVRAGGDSDTKLHIPKPSGLLPQVF